MKFLIIPAILTGFAVSDPLPLIPLPVSVKTQEGSFAFSPATGIRYDRNLKAEAELFATDLQALTGTACKTAPEEQRILLPSEIRLDLDPAADLPSGGYKLEIPPKTVVITAKEPAGVYYGTRTILQLLPAMGDAVWKDSTPEDLPALQITDYPRFAWRGMMSDHRGAGRLTQCQHQRGRAHHAGGAVLGAFVDETSDVVQRVLSLAMPDPAMVVDLIHRE